MGQSFLVRRSLGGGGSFAWAKPKASPVIALLVALFAAACASHAPVASAVSPPVVHAVDTTAFIARGCYRCLESAFAMASSAGMREEAFEAAALLAARSKELGLPPRPWIDQARAWLPAGADGAMYLDIVSALRVEPLSGDRDAILTETTLRRIGRDVIAAWREDLKGGTGSRLFRVYLDLSLACGIQAADREEVIEEAREQFPDVPLIMYRVGLCGVQWPPQLLTMREADPDFVDADLPIARHALDVSQQPDQEEALRRYASLRAAFPSSPLFPASIGSVHQEREEWPEALAAYDATLALVPTHRDALLGRTVSLSNLGRHEEAIASATRLLDLGSWFIGGAHFWRAWNDYHLGNIESARADVDRAKTMMVSAPTYTLSGMIDWRQKQLDTSETEFVEALKVDAGQCEAAALLGGVRAETQRWAEAVAALKQAQRCFDLRATLRRRIIANIAAGPGSPEGKARLIAAQQRALAEAEQHRNDAAQNAEQIQKRYGLASR